MSNGPKDPAGYTISRRNRRDMWTPEEVAIHDALDAVEALGAHPLLTDVVVLLGHAQSKLADYIDAHPAVARKP